MNSIKKDNKGFTLIELLITIVIIGVVAVPFLSSFIQTINTNVKARRLQNATLAAQDLAEEFKSDSLEDLLDEYTHTVVSEADKLDVYKFADIPVTGANGEKFYLDVVLDPNIVENAAGEQVNGVALPLFSSLYGGNTMMIFKQYVEPDTTVNRATSKKMVDISVECVGAEIDGKYVYTYTITFYVGYELADGTVTPPMEKTVSKIYAADDEKTAYLLAPVFSTSANYGTDLDGSYMATDEINITYNYTGAPVPEPEFTFYLAEQASQSKVDASKQVRINAANVTVKNGASAAVPLKSYNSTINKFKINTNVGKRLAETVTKGSLTYSADNFGKSLYMMDINVTYRDKDGSSLTTFSTTKEE